MTEKSLRDSELYETRFAFQERNANFRFLAFVLVMLLAMASFWAYWFYNFGVVVVDGGSMKQTLQHEDRLVMRYADVGEAERGDIIVVDVSGYKECKGVKSGFLIKRLIATEGDSLYCIDGQIYIRYAGENDYVPLDEPYAYYGTNDAYKSEYDFGEYHVGEGEIFFLGDNRSSSGSSVDSRFEQGASGSHLYKTKELYKKEDICATVSAWSVRNRGVWKKIFFWL